MSPGRARHGQDNPLVPVKSAMPSAMTGFRAVSDG